MPPRNASLHKASNLSQYLNLPFLAPRLLAPWPIPSVQKKAYATHPTRPRNLSFKNAPGLQHIDTRCELSGRRYGYGEKSIYRSRRTVILRDGSTGARCYSTRTSLRSTAPAVRTKYVRFVLQKEDNPDDALRTWTTNFADISRRFDRLLASSERSTSLRPQRFPSSRHKAQLLQLLADASVQKFRNRWQQLSPEDQQTAWPGIMLYLLEKRPRLGLRFLMATACKPYPPSYAVSDSLEHIVCCYLYDVKDANPRDLHMLHDSIMQLLSNHPDYAQLTDKTMYWLFRHLDATKTAELYLELVRLRQPMHENTLLHLVDIFARAGNTTLACDVLRHLKSTGADFSKSQVLSVCTTLLQRRYRGKSNSISADSELFALMLELGLRPNIVTYNVLISNALERGDSTTAWKIYDMIVEKGVKADEWTYSILLNDAKARMDKETIERILQQAKAENIHNEYVVTDLLHAMYLLHEEEKLGTVVELGSGSPFRRMLALYDEHFQIGPLRNLLPPRYLEALPPGDSSRPLPPKQTHVVMLIALLRGFNRPKSATNFYARFHQLVLDGHPDVLPLVQSSHIYDGIIMSLGRWSNTLPLCTKVIGDMISLCSSSRKQSGTGNGIAHCPPTVHTWSILLKAFMDHNQPRAAEKVLAMMQSRGITPNQVTWNTLLTGYARQQDVVSTVHALERLEGDGWKVDEVTMKGLQRLHNREALMLALQRKEAKGNGARVKA